MSVRSLALIALALAIPAYAQTTAPTPKPLQPSIATHPDWPAAKNPADVDTVEHLMASLYDVISGPAGQQRDWARFRSLFLPDARMGVIRPAIPASADKPAYTGDAILFARGINTLQIVHAQGRYWIANIMWDEERPGLALPEKYLKQP